MSRIILVEGPSGVGKSTALRTLDTTKTLIINTERKRLPFKGSSKFTEKRPKTFRETMDLLKLCKGREIETIAIDSLSALLEISVRECRILYSGYDIWSNYNTRLGDFFLACKDLLDEGKYIIIFGHDDIISDEAGVSKVRLKVKGNEWAGVVEREFDMVFYAEARVTDNGKIEYKFRTQTDGRVPAKTPMGMFEDLYIDNDLGMILEKIKEYDQD